MAVPYNIEKVLEQFTKEIKGLFGKETISVIVFGSAVTEEFDPRKSDVNFLVVLSEKGIKQIGKAFSSISKWEKRRITLPLFVTSKYIQASLDSFPIEFINMQSAYKVMLGEDVLAPLKFKKKDIRLACERELKGKLLHLRQSYLLTKGRVRALRQLIKESLVTFVSIFKALLYFKGVEIPKTKQEVLLDMCQEFKLDEGLFSILLAVRSEGVQLSKKEYEKNCLRYISEIEKLTELVDKIKV